jgi:hypothetical protein
MAGSSAGSLALYRQPGSARHPKHYRWRLVTALRRFIGGQGFAAIGNRRFRGGRFIAGDVFFPALSGAVSRAGLAGPSAAATGLFSACLA